MAIYSWNTKKTEKGYKYFVKQIIPRNKPTKAGYYAVTKIIKSGFMPTRARAKTQAIKWVRYYKSK